MTGFEKSWLLCTQQQEHFSPSSNSSTHALANNSDRYGVGGRSCPGCFCCSLFLRLVRHPHAFRQSLKWLHVHLLLTSRELAVI